MSILNKIMGKGININSIARDRKSRNNISTGWKKSSITNSGWSLKKYVDQVVPGAGIVSEVETISNPGLDKVLHIFKLRNGKYMVLGIENGSLIGPAEFSTLPESIRYRNSIK